MTKVFPIGKGSRMHRADLTVTHVDPTSTTFTGDYFESSAHDLGYTLPSTIDLVSSIGYWEIKKGAGASLTNAAVKLCYNDTDNVVDPDNLRIAKDDGAGSWVDLGGTGTGITTGSITSTTNFTSFSVFPLANNTGGNNTLPISLLYFHAKLYGNEVSLSWQTASELNNHYFNVERSKDGYNFSTLTVVNGAGNSNDTKSYEALDYTPYYGTSFYRLKQTDYDGKLSYSPITSVFNSKKLIMSIFPNPVVAGQVPQISFSGLAEGEEYQLEIIDVSGNIIYSKIERETSMIIFFNLNHISKLTKGIYFISLKFQGKVVKQKLIVH